MRVRRTVSVIAIAATVAATAVAVRPSQARAVDPPDPITGGITQWFSYLGGLANKGPLAADLTGTTLDVGGPNGLDLKGLAGQLNGESWATASGRSMTAVR
jgi:hypothetical protein